MAQTVKLKRSAVAAKIPLTTDLSLGELAVNTHDGVLYTLMNDGTNKVVQLGGQSVIATATAGTNTQGQGPLTGNINVVTSTAANPSGVTLPTALLGEKVYVVNKGTNPINVYPASGGQIDALGTNISLQIPVNGIVEFNATSPTQWYSSVTSTLISPLITSAVLSGTLTAGSSTGSSGQILSSTGTGVQWINNPAGATATASNSLLDSITAGFNGTTTTFNLTLSSVAYTPVNAEQLTVVLGGIVQKPGTDYTVSTSTITFTTAPISTLDCFIIANGGYSSVPDGDKGDITVSSSGSTWTIDNNVVTNAKLAQVATSTFKGRVTAATGNVEDLTGTQATTLLDTFTSTLKGLAPASGGGTTNYLRADGTWVTLGSLATSVNWTSAESTAAPNATVPVESLTATNAGFADIDVAFVTKGQGAISAQVPDGTTAGGNKRGIYSTDWSRSRTTVGQVASGQYSTISGGRTNTASSSDATVAGGNSNSATQTASVVGGGTLNNANGSHSCIPGGRRGNARSIVGNFVFPACLEPIAATAGVSQAALLILGRQTTDATVTTLCSDSAAASTSNQLTLAANSAYYVRGSVIANVTGAGNTKAWTFEGVVKRGATAASTAIVGTFSKNVIAADAGASAWNITIAADTTNGALQVQVTGQASTTIRWVCKLESTEVTF